MEVKLFESFKHKSLDMLKKISPIWFLPQNTQLVFNRLTYFDQLYYKKKLSNSKYISCGYFNNFNFRNVEEQIHRYILIIILLILINIFKEFITFLMFQCYKGDVILDIWNKKNSLSIFYVWSHSVLKNKKLQNLKCWFH